MKFAVHQLRINVKSLAAEARYIREEIKKARTSDYKNALVGHKKWRLKPEARLAHLALAFAKGVPYHSVEVNSRTTPECSELRKKLKRFFDFRQVSYEAVQAWLSN